PAEGVRDTERDLHQGLRGVPLIMSSAPPVLEAVQAPPRPAPKGPAARLARIGVGGWALRGTALIYLAAMVVLPLVAVVTKGFGQGLGNLQDALATPGAWAAIRLTVVTSLLTAIVNGVF